MGLFLLDFPLKSFERKIEIILALKWSIVKEQRIILDKNRGEVLSG